MNEEEITREDLIAFKESLAAPTVAAIGDGRIMDQLLRLLQMVIDNWDIIGPIFGRKGAA